VNNDCICDVHPVLVTPCPQVTNSAYTNAVAKLSLGYAAAAAQILGQPPSVYAQWLDVGGRLPVPLNTSTGRAGVPAFHNEYQGFDGRTTIKQVRASRSPCWHVCHACIDADFC